MWTEICAFALSCVGDGWDFTKSAFVCPDYLKLYRC